MLVFRCATATKLITCQIKMCEVAAQSGYDGYCKRCFKTLFAALHRAKQLQRLKPCIACMQLKELYATGLCKPCTRARLKRTCFVLVTCDHCRKNSIAFFI